MTFQAPSFSASVVVWAPNDQTSCEELTFVVYVACWWEVTNSVTKGLDVNVIQWPKLLLRIFCMFFLRVLKHNSPLAIQRGAILFPSRRQFAAPSLWQPKTGNHGGHQTKQRKLPLPNSLVARVVMESALSLEGAPHGPPNGQLDGVWLNADCPWEEYTVSWMKSFLFGTFLLPLQIALVAQDFAGGVKMLGKVLLVRILPIPSSTIVLSRMFFLYALKIRARYFLRVLCQRRHDMYPPGN